MPKKRSNQLRWSYAEEKYPGGSLLALASNATDSKAGIIASPGGGRDCPPHTR